MSSAAQQSGAEVWTTRRLLAWMSEAFAKSGLDSGRLCAELLLSHVIGCDRLKLYTEADRPASPLERQTLRDLVARALKNEPIQYLVGEWWFFGLPFKIDKRVLIPRPSTETIVDIVLRHARAAPGLGGVEGDGTTIADVCTGSGCIAVTLAKNMKRAHVIASDISEDALEVARSNAARHGLSQRVEFVSGNLLEPLYEHPGGRNLAYLCANPPYVPDSEWEAVPANVKDYEPHSALRGGADGLEFVRPIVHGAPDLLRPGGLLLVEIAMSTAPQVLAMAQAVDGLIEARIDQDCEGLPRVLVAKKKD